MIDAIMVARFGSKIAAPRVADKFAYAGPPESLEAANRPFNSVRRRMAAHMMLADGVARRDTLCRCVRRAL